MSLYGGERAGSGVIMEGRRTFDDYVSYLFGEKPMADAILQR